MIANVRSLIFFTLWSIFLSPMRAHGQNHATLQGSAKFASDGHGSDDGKRADRFLPPDPDILGRLISGVDFSPQDVGPSVEPTAAPTEHLLSPTEEPLAFPTQSPAFDVLWPTEEPSVEPTKSIAG